MYSVGYVGGVEYRAPGSEQPNSFFVSQVASSAELPALVQPLIGSATQFKVNGKDALTSQSGIGLTPTLTWSEPSVGRVDGYEIVVLRIYSDAMMRSQSQRVATLTTTKTTATLPPGVLADDTAYLIKLTAKSLPTVDMNRAPFRRCLPEGGADVASAVLQVK